MSTPNVAQLEHLLLRPDATEADVRQCCERARQLGIAALCVPGSRIALAAALLEGSDVKVVALVGAPHGAADADVKRYEAEVAVDCGAQELVLIPNPGWLRDASLKAVLRELRDVIETADERPVTVELNPRFLTRDELLVATRLAAEAGAQAVSLRQPNVEEASWLHKQLPASLALRVTALSDARTAQSYLDAGAERAGVIVGGASA